MIRPKKTTAASSSGPVSGPAPERHGVSGRDDLRASFWAALTGIGLGGLFDGVLLHRMLGWHSLLSTAAPTMAAERHLQADGLLDAAMVLAVVAGLTGALANRATIARLHPRRVTGAALAGFGAWHLADAVLVHWVLRLHRIRPAADQPILWDIGWLICFGLLPLLVAWTLRARPRNGPDARV